MNACLEGHDGWKPTLVLATRTLTLRRVAFLPVLPDQAGFAVKLTLLALYKPPPVASAEVPPNASPHLGTVPRPQRPS